MIFPFLLFYIITWNKCILSLCFLPIQQPESEEFPQARYPQPPPAPPLPSSSPTPAQPEKTTVNRLEQVQVATSGERNISAHPIYSLLCLIVVNNNMYQNIQWWLWKKDVLLNKLCDISKTKSVNWFFFLPVIKGFNQPKAAGSEITVSADKTILPGANLLSGRKLLGDMKSIKSLKQSGLSGVFNGQAVSKQSAFVFFYIR